MEIKFLNDDGNVITNIGCGAGWCNLKPSKANIERGVTEIDGSISWPSAGTMSFEDPVLCKVLPDTSSCGYSDWEDTETTIENIKIPTNNPGTIIAEIDSGSISECSLHNTTRIYCGKEKFKFFTIDYYAWVK